MKKTYFIIVTLAVIVFGCSKKDDPTPDPVNTTNNGGNTGGGSTGGGNTTFLDADGDGVANETEIADATDPDDPCSFLLASQEYNRSTEDWKSLDCDGDGVINGTEVDPDGNNQNEGNGTDPLDSCNLVFTDQTVPTSTSWREGNCDGDCFLNDIEIKMGTNPTNPTLPEIGPYLSRIYYFNDFDGYMLFENQGTEYQGYRTSAFGSVETRYDYNGDNLERVRFIESEQGVLYEVIFSYNGDQLTLISGTLPTYNVTYEGNSITAIANTGAPPNLFSTKLELDGSTQKIVKREQYFWDYGTTEYEYVISTYQYDAQQKNVTEIQVERSLYDSDTEEYTFIETFAQEYSYFENVINPAQEAFKKIEIPSLLIVRNNPDGFFIGPTYMSKAQLNMSSANLLQSATNISPFSGMYETDLCAENEGKPRVIYELPYFNGRIFNYSD